MTDILQYIPQRPPFVMIDSIISADDSTCVTSFTIPDNHLFTSEGFFTEPGLVENIAQTAAASTGHKASQNNQEAPVGFIGAIKNLHITQLPQVHTTITTIVHFGMQVMNAQIVTGTVEQNGITLASCELKIFIQQ